MRSVAVAANGSILLSRVALPEVTGAPAKITGMNDPVKTTTLHDSATEELLPLRQSDATMLILYAVCQDSKPVPRLLVEGIASIARSPLCKDSGSRILDVFITGVWYRRLYESLAHLDTNRCIRPITEGYVITSAGEERVRGIPHSEDELSYIRQIAETVCRKLSIRG